jgi:branched-chain amino acid transport system permease protein
MAGVVGAFYAPFFGYLNPSQFDIWVSFQVLVWVLLGGSGTVIGAIVGTAILWVFPVAVRLDPALTLVLYGVLVIVVMVAYRRGLLGLIESVLAVTRSALSRKVLRAFGRREPSTKPD